MKSFQYSQITDELLSAYLDDDLARHERELVEAAVAADAKIAWRLESLRQTVQLLSNLPYLAPKRSFLLDESMVGDITAARRQATARRRNQAPGGTVSAAMSTPTGTATAIGIPPATATPDATAQPPGWQARWRAFWQGGNPMLRNLATASLVLAIFVAGAESLLIQPSSPASPALVVMQQESASAPASSDSVAAEMESDSTAGDETAAADMAMDTLAVEENEEDSADAMPEASVQSQAASEEMLEDEMPEEAAGEEIALARAMPPLGTPDTLENVAPNAEAGTLEADMAPLAAEEAIAEGDVAEEAPEDDIGEGGFGDADAPQLLHGQAPTMSGGDGTGMGGGGSDDPPGAIPPTNPAALMASPAITEDLPVEEETSAEAAPAARAAMVETAEEEEEPATEARITADVESANPATTAQAEIDQAAITQAAKDESDGAEADVTDSDIAEPESPEPTQGERVAILPDPPTSDPVEESADAPVDVAADDSVSGPDADENVAADIAEDPAADAGADAASTPDLLTWLQWSFMAIAASFGLLWWRSRDATGRDS
ncbi:MAG: hypothetical protein WDZ49_08335 [Litorilinea sp.]